MFFSAAYIYTVQDVGQQLREDLSGEVKAVAAAAEKEKKPAAKKRPTVEKAESSKGPPTKKPKPEPSSGVSAWYI